MQGPQASVSADRQPTIYAPIAGGPWTKSSPYGPRWGRMHSGLDVACPEGTPCVAPVNGKVVYASETGFSGGGMIHFEFEEDLGDIKAGDVIGWGHIFDAKISSGNVSGGEVIATSGDAGTGPHVHFVYLPGGNDGGSQIDGTTDPEKVYDYLSQGEAPIGIASGGDLSGGGASGGMLDEATAKAASFATYFQIEGLFDTVTSQVLTGERSLMNDKPLFPFIEQLCSASLRRFQSMPNGNFFAFYPDYFGGSGHRSPYWEITDTEIIDGQIELNDDSLATHVYVVGDTSPHSFFDGVDVRDKVDTAGFINIFNAFQANFITGHNQQTRAEKNSDSLVDEVIDGDAFLKKYGARPYYEEAPMVRSAFYEAFLAYQKFCLLWSEQFATNFSLTFMPEIFPGGIVKFAEHGIQMFVEEVTHSFDFETGFNTDVVFSSPASTNGGRTHEGMIREGVLKGR